MFLTILIKKVMFFHCVFQWISIKLQLGYFDKVKKIQKTPTHTIKHDNIKKNMIFMMSYRLANKLLKKHIHTYTYIDRDR